MKQRDNWPTWVTGLANNDATEMLEIEKFSDLLHIHPIHLSNTIKEVTGTSACEIYQDKIIILAKKLLLNPTCRIKEIALLLDFEPSQFTKWFKRFNGVTPKVYREMQFLKS